jgi:hypothetical protein
MDDIRNAYIILVKVPFGKCPDRTKDDDENRVKIVVTVELVTKVHGTSKESCPTTGFGSSGFES